MKNILELQHIISAAAMTGTQTITSTAMEIKYVDNVAVQLVWTGTPNGTFQVQASLDYAKNPDGSVANAGTWINVTLPSSVTASGSAGNALLDLNQLSMPWLRVQYVNSSGTGTLDAWLFGKSV